MEQVKMENMSYPKIVAGDHSKSTARKWDKDKNYEWFIEEKMDGSNLGMQLMKKDATKGDELVFNCRGRILKAPHDWMFDKAISALCTLKPKLNPNYVYFGETISKQRHNVIQYQRIPRFFFVLFDIYNLAEKTYLSRAKLESEADKLGLECAPLLFQNKDPSVDPKSIVSNLLKTHPGSLLGPEVRPEGFVLKHHTCVKPNGHMVATKKKYVSEQFRESHKCKSKTLNQNLTADQCLDLIMSWYPKETRWQKAKQRLRDQGKITGEDENAQKERNAIMTEARRDFQEEEQETLKNLLWSMFGQQLVQRITEGM